MDGGREGNEQRDLLIVGPGVTSVSVVLVFSCSEVSEQEGGMRGSGG